MEESTATVPKDVPLQPPSLASATQPYSGRPPPSPLSGGYLLIVISETLTDAHKAVILQKLAKAFLSWNVEDSGIDIERELAIVTALSPEGDFAKNGERLIQNASEHLVTEILIHPQINTMRQCIRNLLSSFTKYRFIIHAGYVFCGNGSWILQDGTFSVSDFIDAFQEIEVQRVIRAYEKTVKIDICCIAEGGWTQSRLQQEPFSKLCHVEINPSDKIAPGNVAVREFVDYLEQYIIPSSIEDLLEPSDIVGNIRFTHPTLYVFPGGEGDAALFGINGFNMLVDGGFGKKACFWNFVRHLDRLDAVLMTRVNNSNIGGMSGVVERKVFSHVYPQVGHFFSNLQARKQLPSPDGDKDREPLLVNLIEEGDRMVMNLKQLQLKPHHCYRDATSDPINLYHKVGHGKLDMYVISPTKDSREVKEFLSRWNNHDVKLFSGTSKTGNRELRVPLQNLVSICALLVWQPANPDDNITRILFPGSTPQHKIFEGLERLKPLEFLKHSTCTVKSVIPAQTPLVSKPIAKKFVSKLDKHDKILDELAKSEAQMKSTLAANENEADSGPRSLPADLVTPATGMVKSTPLKPKRITGKSTEKAVMKDIKSKTDLVVKEETAGSKQENISSQKSTSITKESINEKKKYERKPVQRPVVAPPPKPKALVSSGEEKKPGESDKSSSPTTPKKSFVERKSAQVKSTTVVTTQEKDAASKKKDKDIIDNDKDQITEKDKSQITDKDKDLATDEDKVQTIDKVKDQTTDKDKDQPVTTVNGTITTSSVSSSATTTATREKESSTTVTTSKEQTTQSSTTTTTKPTSRPTPRTRTPPKVFPAKSLKDENNRKVAESKPMRSAPAKIVASSKSIKKEDESIVKAEKKAIVKRTKPPAAPASVPASTKPALPAKSLSPVKVTRKPISIASKKPTAIGDDKKLKPDTEKTDSSAVSTPSTLEADTTLLKTKVKSESTKAKSVESAKDTKSTAIKKIRPKPKTTTETQPVKTATEPVPIKPTAPSVPSAVPETTTYVSNIITKQGDDEEDEILIIETTEMKSISKHDYEEQKHLRDQTESEKQVKEKYTDVAKFKQEQSLDLAQINATKAPKSEDKSAVKLTPEDKEKIFGEVQGIISTATEMIATSAKSPIDQKVSSPAADKPESPKPPIKEPVHASQETSSTTAPTMPEDEKIDFDEPPKQQEEIEEKYDKEETKEKSLENGQRSKIDAKILLVEQTSEEAIRKAKRDIVKTPDEVADLPVHEEVDTHEYETTKTDDDQFVAGVTTAEPVIEVVKLQHPEFVTITSTSTPEEKPLPAMTPLNEKDIVDGVQAKPLITETTSAIRKDSLSFEKVTHETDVSPTSPQESVQAKDNLAKDEFITIDLHSSQLKSSADTTPREESPRKEFDKDDTDKKLFSSVDSRRASKDIPSSDEKFAKIDKRSSKDYDALSSSAQKIIESAETTFPQSPTELTELDEKVDKSSRKESLKEFLDETSKLSEIKHSMITEEKLTESKTTAEKVEQLSRKESLKVLQEEISKSSLEKSPGTLEDEFDSESIPHPIELEEKVGLVHRKESLKISQDETSKLPADRSPTSTKDEFDSEKIPSPIKVEEIDLVQRKESLKVSPNETSKLPADKSPSLTEDEHDSKKITSPVKSEEKVELSSRKESLNDLQDETSKLPTDKSPSPPEDERDSEKIPSPIKLEEIDLVQRKESLKVSPNKTSKLPADKSSSPTEDEHDSEKIPSPVKSEEKVELSSRKESLKDLQDETSKLLTDKSPSPPEDERDFKKIPSPVKSEEKEDLSSRKQSLKDLQDETSKLPTEKSPSPTEDRINSEKIPSPIKLEEKIDSVQRKESLKVSHDEMSKLPKDKSPTSTKDKLVSGKIPSPAELDEKIELLQRKESLKSSEDDTSKLPADNSPGLTEDEFDSEKIPSPAKSEENVEIPSRKESMKDLQDETSKLASEKSPTSPVDKPNSSKPSLSPTESSKLPEESDQLQRKQSLKEFLNETSKWSQEEPLSSKTDTFESTKRASIELAKPADLAQRKESLKEIPKSPSAEVDYKVPDEKSSSSEKKEHETIATTPTRSSFDETNKLARKQSVKFSEDSLEIIPSEDLSNDQFTICKSKSRKRSVTADTFLDDDDQISPKTDGAVPLQESPLKSKTKPSEKEQLSSKMTEIVSDIEISPIDRKSSLTTTEKTSLKDVDQSSEKSSDLKEPQSSSKHVSPSGEYDPSDTAKTPSDKGSTEIVKELDTLLKDIPKNEITKRKSKDELTLAEVIRSSAFDETEIIAKLDDEVSKKSFSPKDKKVVHEDENITTLDGREPLPNETLEKPTRKESLPETTDRKISIAESLQDSILPKDETTKPGDEVDAKDSKESSPIKTLDKSIRKESLPASTDPKTSSLESLQGSISPKDDITKPEDNLNTKESPTKSVDKSTRKESLLGTTDQKISPSESLAGSISPKNDITKPGDEIDTKDSKESSPTTTLDKLVRKESLPVMTDQKISPSKSLVGSVSLKDEITKSGDKLDTPESSPTKFFDKSTRKESLPETTDQKISPSESLPKSTSPKDEIAKPEDKLDTNDSKESFPTKSLHKSIKKETLPGTTAQKISPPESFPDSISPKDEITKPEDKIDAKDSKESSPTKILEKSTKKEYLPEIIDRKVSLTEPSKSEVTISKDKTGEQDMIKHDSKEPSPTKDLQKPSREESFPETIDKKISLTESLQRPISLKDEIIESEDAPKHDSKKISPIESPEKPVEKDLLPEETAKPDSITPVTKRGSKEDTTLEESIKESIKLKDEIVAKVDRAESKDITPDGLEESAPIEIDSITGAKSVLICTTTRRPSKDEVSSKEPTSRKESIATSNDDQIDSTKIKSDSKGVKEQISPQEQTPVASVDKLDSNIITNQESKDVTPTDAIKEPTSTKESSPEIVDKKTDILEVTKRPSKGEFSLSEDLEKSEFPKKFIQESDKDEPDFDKTQQDSKENITHAEVHTSAISPKLEPAQDSTSSIELVSRSTDHQIIPDKVIKDEMSPVDTTKQPSPVKESTTAVASEKPSLSETCKRESKGEISPIESKQDTISKLDGKTESFKEFKSLTDLSPQFDIEKTGTITMTMRESDKLTATEALKQSVTLEHEETYKLEKAASPSDDEQTPGTISKRKSKEELKLYDVPEKSPTKEGIDKKESLTEAIKEPTSSEKSSPKDEKISSPQTSKSPTHVEVPGKTSSEKPSPIEDILKDDSKGTPVLQESFTLTEKIPSPTMTTISPKKEDIASSPEKSDKKSPTSPQQKIMPTQSLEERQDFKQDKSSKPSSKSHEPTSQSELDEKSSDKHTKKPDHDLTKPLSSADLEDSHSLEHRSSIDNEKPSSLENVSDSRDSKTQLSPTGKESAESKYKLDSKSSPDSEKIDQPSISSPSLESSLSFEQKTIEEACKTDKSSLDRSFSETNDPGKPSMDTFAWETSPVKIADSKTTDSSDTTDDIPIKTGDILTSEMTTSMTFPSSQIESADQKPSKESSKTSSPTKESSKTSSPTKELTTVIAKSKDSPKVSPISHESTDIKSQKDNLDISLTAEFVGATVESRKQSITKESPKSSIIPESPKVDSRKPSISEPEKGTVESRKQSIVTEPEKNSMISESHKVDSRKPSISSESQKDAVDSRKQSIIEEPESKEVDSRKPSISSEPQKDTIESRKESIITESEKNSIISESQKIDSRKPSISSEPGKDTVELRKQSIAIELEKGSLTSDSQQADSRKPSTSSELQKETVESRKQSIATESEESSITSDSQKVDSRKPSISSELQIDTVESRKPSITTELELKEVNLRKPSISSETPKDTIESRKQSMTAELEKSRISSDSQQPDSGKPSIPSEVQKKSSINDLQQTSIDQAYLSKLRSTDFSEVRKDSLITSSIQEQKSDIEESTKDSRKSSIVSETSKHTSPQLDHQSISKLDSGLTEVTRKESVDISSNLKKQSYSIESQISSEFSCNESVDFSIKSTPKTPSPKDLSASPSSDISPKHENLETSPIKKQEIPSESRKSSVIHEYPSTENASLESKKDSLVDQFSREFSIEQLTEVSKKIETITGSHIEISSSPTVSIDQLKYAESLSPIDKQSLNISPSEHDTKQIKSDVSQSKSPDSSAQSPSKSSSPSENLKPEPSVLTTTISKETAKDAHKIPIDSTSPIAQDSLETSPAKDISPIKPESSITSPKTPSSGSDAKLEHSVLTSSISKESEKVISKTPTEKVSPISQGSLETSPSKDTSPKKPEHDGHSRKESMVLDSKRNSYVFESRASTESIAGSVDGDSDSRYLSRGSIDTMGKFDTATDDYTSKSFERSSDTAMDFAGENIASELHKESLGDVSLTTKTITETTFISSSTTSEDYPKFTSKRSSIVSDSQRSSIAYELNKDNVDMFSTEKSSSPEKMSPTTKSSIDDAKTTSQHTSSIEKSLAQESITVSLDKQPEVATDSRKSSVQLDKKEISPTIKSSPDKQPEIATDSRKSSLIADSRKSSVQLDKKDTSPTTKLTPETSPKKIAESPKSSLADSKRGSLITEADQDIRMDSIPGSRQSSISISDQRTGSLSHDFEEKSSKVSPDFISTLETKQIIESSETKTFSKESAADSRKSSSASLVGPSIADSVSKESATANSRKSSLVSDSRKASLSLDLGQAITTAATIIKSVLTGDSSKDDAESRKSSLLTDSRKISESVESEHLTKDTADCKALEAVTSMITSGITETKDEPKDSKPTDISKSKPDSSITDEKISGTQNITKTPSQHSITDSRKSSISDSRKESIVSDSGKISPVDDSSTKKVSLDTSPQHESIERKTDSRKPSSDLPTGGIKIESDTSSANSKISSTIESEQISSSKLSLLAESTIVDKYIVTGPITSITSTTDTTSTKEVTVPTTDSRKGSLISSESRKSSLATDATTTVEDSSTKTTSQSPKQSVTSITESVTTSSISSSSQSKNIAESSTVVSTSSTDEGLHISKLETESSTTDSLKIEKISVSPIETKTVSTTCITQSGIESGIISSTIDTTKTSHETVSITEQTKDISSKSEVLQSTKSSTVDSKTSSIDISSTKRDSIPTSISLSLDKETLSLQKSPTTKDNDSISSSLTKQQIIISDSEMRDSSTIQTSDQLSKMISTHEITKESAHITTSKSPSPDDLQFRKLSSHQLGTVSTLETCDIDLSHRSPSPDFHSHKSATYTFTNIGSPDDNSSLTETYSRQDLGFVEPCELPKSDLKSSVVTEQISYDQNGHELTKTTTHITTIQSETSDADTKMMKTIDGDSQKSTATTTTTKIITSELPSKAITQDTPVTSTTSTTCVETVSEIDPSETVTKTIKTIDGESGKTTTTTTTTKIVTSELPSKAITQDTPITSTMSTTSVKTVSETDPSEAVTKTIQSEDGKDTTTITTTKIITSEPPPRTISQDTPITSTTSTSHIETVSKIDTSDAATKTTKTIDDSGKTITTTTTITTSESPRKNITEDTPITSTTGSTTHVETVSEIDPSSIDPATFAALSSDDYPGAANPDGTYSTIEYQTITKYVVIPSTDGSPSRIKKYTTEIIPTLRREISRAEYEKLHDIGASAAADAAAMLQQDAPASVEPIIRQMDCKSYDCTATSATIKHGPVTKSVSEPKILTSPDSGALHMDANQMRVQFLADSSSLITSTAKKSSTGAVISKSSSDETYDATASDTLSDLSSNKFHKKDVVSKTVSLPILDEVTKPSNITSQSDPSEDISKSLTYLEKISYMEGSKSTILSDPSSLNKQIEDVELKSKSVSLPVIKRPDDSEKYMTLPNLYKSANLEDLTADDTVVEGKPLSTEASSSVHAIAPIKETDESIDDENQPTLIRKVIETTTKITSQLVGALQHDSSSPQRSHTPCSEDRESDDGRSDTSLEQCSRITQHSGGAGQICESDEDEELAGSTISTSSNKAHFKEEDEIQDQLASLQEETMRKMSSSMTQSFYGTYPDDDPEDELPEDSRVTTTTSTSSTVPQTGQDAGADEKKDPIKDWGRPLGLPNVRNIDRFLIWNPIEEWGRPLGLPTPAPPPPSMQDRDSNGDIEINLAPINPPTNNVTKSTPTKKVPKKPVITEKINTARETSKTRDSSVKRTKPTKPTSPVYVDLAYVPHHGNPYYTTVEFFKRIRARYYVFSGTDPSKDVFNALIDAKKTWEDQTLEVTIIPTYDTDVLGYWITENEETLTNLKIDLSPSASRCTINLQDHDTSCSAYRLEF